MVIKVVLKGEICFSLDTLRVREIAGVLAFTRLIGVLLEEREDDRY